MLLTHMIFQQADSAAAAGGGLIGSLMLPVAMIAIFYFLLIRPQQQRAKKHKAVLEALKKGDKVVTNGGLIGKITKAEDHELTIDTGEGNKVRVVRSMIMSIYTAPTPTPANDTADKKED